MRALAILLFALVLVGACARTAPPGHRPVATPCVSHVEDVPEPYVPPVEKWPAAKGPVGCHSHADCTAGRNGRCRWDGFPVFGTPGGGSYCVYEECVTDADCPSGPCICGDSSVAPNFCGFGNCKVDADCGDGEFCDAPPGSFALDCSYDPNIPTYWFNCHSDRDDCTVDGDCDDGKRCRWNQDARGYRCEEIGYCARPGAAGL